VECCDVATASECEAALREAVGRLANVDRDVRDRHALDRTFSCRVPDIDADFSARVEDGVIVGPVPRPDRDAQIKLTIDSDDLVALTRGDLPVGNALASGRLRVDASVFDLLRLGQLL
jgi:hypothetical protein